MTFIRRTLLIIFAVLFCFIIWWIGPIVAIGKYHPFAAVWIRVVLITIIMVLVLWPLVAIFLSFIFRYFSRPFTQPKTKTKDKDRLTTRFYDALATLKRAGVNDKKSFLSRILYIYNRPYINDKPWYLILGDDLSGKTSMIFQSGEKFLYAENYGIGQTTSVGATQDCNIWITDRAVYIDTAGGWLQLDNKSDQISTAIKRFFKLIKKYRKAPKIDGLILCIDALWLQKSNITELKTFADSLRVRIQDISSTLSADIPVYFFINKIDLLPGAKEFLYMFNDEIIKHGLGLSAPAIEINSRSLDYFKDFFQRYTLWSKKLSHYLLEILQDTLDDRAREYLFNFVEALGSLRKPLFQIVEQTFPSFPRGYSGYIHDIWYGTSISLKMDEYDQDPKLLGEIFYPALTRMVNSRGFLHSLGAKQRKWTWGTWVSYGALLLFVMICIFILVSKYIWEIDYISYVTEKFKEAKRIIKEVQMTNKVSDQLIYAYEQLGYINSQLTDMKSASKSKSLNPYIEHILIDQATKQTYHNHLVKFFWPAVENYVTDILSNEVQGNSDEIYNTLRIYQMLVKADHRSSDEFVNWFMQRWTSFAPVGYTENDKLIFEFHLRELFDGFKNNPPVIKPNANLVYQAILKSSELPMTLRVIHRIMELPLPGGINPVSLVTAAGNNVSLMLKLKSNKTVVDDYVPAFYTRSAYKDLFLEKLDQISKDVIDELSWVLNDNSQLNASKIGSVSFLQKLKDDTIKQYLINFTDIWNKFLHDITIRPIQNLEDSAFLASQLSDPASPLANLIRFVSREVNLTGTQDGRTGNWFERNAANIENKKREVIGELSGERARFRITPERLLEDRFRPILVLGDKLNNADNVYSNPLTRLFEDVYNMIYPLSLLAKSYPSAQQQKQEEAVFNQIKIKATNQPDPIKSILLDLINSSESKVVEEMKTNLSNETNSLFTELCRKTIQSKYPFNKRAGSEISRDDFIKMFAPSGTIDQFFKDNVSQLVTGYGDDLKPLSTKDNIVDPEILASFKKVANIKDVFFDQGGTNIKLSMYIRPVALSSNIYEAVLDINGQSINYSHGYAKEVKIDWPGNNSNDAIRLVFKTSEGTVKIRNFTGSWSLFRLFDSSRIIKSGADYKIISLSVPGTEGTIEFEIKSDMESFPLWSNTLSGFSCP